MSLTPNSSVTPYCTGTQFVTVFDWRTVADLLSDTDTALSTQSAVINSLVLAEFLKEGAGEIESYTSIGNRYQPSDLTALAGSGTVMASRLARLNASITMEYCWRHRPDKEMPSMPEFDEAAKMLVALSEGHLVFGFIETMNAGVLQDYKEVPSDVTARNLPSRIANKLFGRRGNRILPPPAGTW